MSEEKATTEELLPQIEIPDGIWDNVKTERREKWKDGKVIRQISASYLLDKKYMHKIGHLEMRGDWKSKPLISIIPNIIIPACHGQKSIHLSDPDDILIAIGAKQKRKPIVLKPVDPKLIKK